MLRMLLAAAMVFVGCRSDQPKVLDAPDQMTVYALDPHEGGGPDYKPKGSDFHKWPVLGKVDVTDAAKRREIMAAVKKGIENGNQSKVATCFIPRHGVRVIEKAQTVDYVICFQCHGVEIYTGKVPKNKQTSNEAETVLNGVLKAAKIEIAK